MKYIIVNAPLAPLTPLLFCESLGHEIVASAFRKEWIDSAGFVTLSSGKAFALVARAHGRSTGLDVAAKEERDSRIITMMLNDSETWSFEVHRRTPSGTRCGGQGRATILPEFVTCSECKKYT